jgi:hypothetical protein
MKESAIQIQIEKPARLAKAMTLMRLGSIVLRA